MKERWNFTPDKRDRWSEPKDKLRTPDRRKFLAAIALLGGSALVPKFAREFLTKMDDIPSYSENDNESRERLLDSAVQTVGQNIRSHALREALAGEGANPLEKVISAIEFPILPKHVTGTSYDVRPIVEKSEAQIALYPKSELSLADRAVIQSSAAFGDRDDFLSPNDASYGNGSYIEPHLVLTAAHVVGMLLDKPEYFHKELDIGLLRTNKQLAARTGTGIVSYNNLLTNNRIHGAFVSIAGIDPDETSEKNGRKVYPGIAVKVSHSLAGLIMRAQEIGEFKHAAFQKRLSRSFMVVLPPGEAKISKDSFPAKGMSGSAVYVKSEKELLFGGIFWAAMRIKVGNKSVDLGFFHGIDEVREAMKEIKVESIPQK